MSNGFIRLCSVVFCWAAISACHALLSSHMTNKDDDDDVLRKAIAFPLWSAIGSRWNRNTISLVSPVTAVMHLPSSCMSSTKSWFHMPAVSTATGTKMWVVESTPYLIALLADALLAAAPSSLAVWPMCDSSKVSGTVTSHATGLLHAHNINVVPPGCLPSCCSKLTGIFDCRYLGPFDCPAQDVHLVMTLLPGPLLQQKDHVHPGRPLFFHMGRCVVHRPCIPVCGLHQTALNPHGASPLNGGKQQPTP